MLRRPLSQQPPLMVEQLVRAITRSPRWFAMHRFFKEQQAGAIAEQQHKATAKAARSKKSKLKSKTPTKKKQQQQQQSDDALVVALKPSQMPKFNVLDCTLGGGTHTEAVLEAGEPFTRVAALDCDAGGVQRRAEIIAKKYGKRRFRYFPPYRFSQIETLFGHNAFDAVIVDPGPSYSQLLDPSRGFSLDDPERFSLFDMRYSTKVRSSALDVINKASPTELWTIAANFALLPPHVARLLTKSIVRRRPFRDLGGVLAAIQHCGSDLGEFSADSWFETTATPFTKIPLVVRFMFALRATVNQEPQELEEGLRAAAEVLDVDGRLIVFSRLPFEKEIIDMFAADHPFMVTSFEQKISKSDAEEFSHPVETRMHVIQKTQETAFELKNIPLAENPQLAERVRKDDEERKMYSLESLGTRNGFPAWNFASRKTPHPEERRAQEANADPPPLELQSRFEKRRLPRR